MNLSPQPISLAQEADFALGSVRVRPALRQIMAADTEELLEPRVMQVLVLLARQAGNVVSRDQLVEQCWGGRIVGEDAIQRAVAKVRRLGVATGGFSIETIARVGYRLIRLDDGVGDRQSASNLPVTVSSFAHELARLPSIGVLPFANLTGDAEQDYFADGISEDIITALSRFREFRTAPRGATFALRQTTPDPAEAGRRMGLGYVLSGSVRAGDSQIRISAELTHCESGRQIWRDSFDRPNTSIFDLQDELSRSVAAVVAPALQGAEVSWARSVPARDVTAHDLYLRALPNMWAGTRNGIMEAIGLLRQSLQRETSATPLAALSLSLVLAPPVGALPPSVALPEALRLACQAVALEASDSFIQATYSMALCFSSFDRAQIVLHAEEAIRLNSGSAISWGALGIARSLTGNFEQALESLELAVRLSPSDGLAYMWLTFKSASCFALERYLDGQDAARRAIVHNPGYGTAHRLLAANLAAQGRVDEACEVTQARDLVQKTSLAEIRKMGLFQQSPVMERYLQVQRLCGVPE
jgi:TolB-like protein/DNA-binding winged helix-turn-helix (wHTH) protein